MITAAPVAPPRRPWHRWVASSAALAIVTGGVGWAAMPASAAVSAGAPVVINEVYGGGGNNGAPLNRDFIELRNTSDAAVSLDGWSVQYASSTGSNWQVTTLAGATIEPGGHLLIGQAVGGDAGLPGFTADIEGSIPMSGTQGKVALVNSTAALSGGSGLAQNDTVVDYVGWGNATDFAGSGAAPATTNATSIARDDVAGNTADNRTDFAAGAPTPQGKAGTTPEQPGEPAVVSIGEIQGPGDTTPLAGATVTTEGVVTAHYATGATTATSFKPPAAADPTTRSVPPPTPSSSTRARPRWLTRSHSATTCGSRVWRASSTGSRNSLSLPAPRSGSIRRPWLPCR